MTNFDTLYHDRNISSWGLPSPSALVPGDGEFRRLLLKWTDLQDPPEAPAPPIRVVCSDVLRLDAIQRIDRPTFIFARRIELSGKAALAIDRIGRPGMDVVVVAQEIVRDGVPVALACVTVGPEPEAVAESALQIESGSAGAPTVSAFRLAADGTLAAAVPAQASADLLYDGAPLALLLSSQFQIASLIFTEDRPLACALAAWVGTLAGGSGRFTDLAAQAHALLGRLETMGSVGEGVTLVPRLDHTLYARQAKAMVATLRDRTATMEKLKDTREVDIRWIDDVKATLADKGNETELARELEHLAEEAFTTASRARTIAAVSVREEAEGLPYLRIDFERGIENWKKKAEFEAALAIVTGLFKIALELPAVFVAGPQILAMPALDTAASVLSWVSDAAKSLATTNWPSLYVPRDGSGGKIESISKDDLIVDINEGFDAKAVKTGEHPPVRGEPRRSSDGDDTGSGFSRNVNGAETKPTRGGDRGPMVLAVNSDEWSDSDLLLVDSPGKEDRDRIVLEGLSNDPDEEFVIVNPSKEAADYATVYKMQVKERAARKKKAAAAQKELVAAAKSIAGSAKGIYDAAIRVIDVAEQAERLEAESVQMLMRVDLAVEGSFGSIAPRGLDVVTGGAQAWDELAAEIQRSFDNMGNLLNEIAGAKSFQFAILRLVRKGRAMSEARLALARANADLAAARLRRQAAQRSLEVFETRLNKLEDATKRRAAMEMLAFDRVLDAKRASWLAMEAYQRAFYYYTLSQGELDDRAPRITEPVPEFDRRARRMGETWVTSARLASAPQEFNLSFELHDDDMETLLTESKGVFTFDYSADDPWFSAWHRIRVKEVEARIVGLDRKDSVLIDVQTSGTYDDRMSDGSLARFVCDPFRISVVYDAASGKVVTPGRVEDRVAKDFFQPTPFTTWRLTMLDQQGKPISFPGARGIEFGLKGVWSRCL